MASTAAYACACLVPIVTAFVVRAFTLTVPFSDEWDWTDLIYKLHLGTLTLADLWRQHNEHRMLIPNAIVLGLASLGGWSQVRETLFSVLLAVVTQIGVFVILRRILDPRRLPYAFLAASLLVYSLAQMENWDWGFQVAWFLCNLCAVTALALLGAAGQSWFALISAALAATVASYSSSQGLMIWVAGLATLLLAEKRRPAQVISWTAIASIVFAVYFRGYQHPAQHPDVALALHHPLTSLRYVGAYAGAVFAGWVGLWPAVALGWAGILAYGALALCVVRDYRVERSGPSRAGALLGLGLYALCVAAITTFGRVGFGTEQAEASRYASIAIYLWIAVFGLAAAYAPSFLRHRPRFAAPLALAAAVLLVLYAGADRAGIELGRGRVAQAQAARPALLAGDGPALAGIYPVPAALRGWIGELRAIKDGPFYP